MKLTKPNYILYQGLYEWDFSPKDRFPYIDNFISENYKIYKEIDKWKILVKN